MKIISADTVPYLEEQLILLEDPAIILLGEGSFNTQSWPKQSMCDLNKIAETTYSRRITLIGTDDEGLSYIVKKGKVIPAQRQFVFDGDSDNLYDVSPNGNLFHALIRICANSGDSYTGVGNADLLLVPHAQYVGNDITVSELIDIHKSTLKKKGLIVTAGSHLGHEPIYNLSGEIVSREKVYGKMLCHEAEV